MLFAVLQMESQFLFRRERFAAFFTGGYWEDLRAMRLTETFCLSLAMGKSCAE